MHFCVINCLITTICFIILGLLIVTPENLFFLHFMAYLPIFWQGNQRYHRGKCVEFFINIGLFPRLFTIVCFKNFRARRVTQENVLESSLHYGVFYQFFTLVSGKKSPFSTAFFKIFHEF